MLLAALGYFTAIWADRVFPPPLPADLPVSASVLDRNGDLLGAFTVNDGLWRFPVSLADVDPRFTEMLLAYEDKRFYRHSGIDLRALLRAGLQLVWHGRIISGGSTITMQLARLLEPRRQRSLAAKVRQALRAVQIERRLDKREILEAYLTLAPYGGNLEGIRAASLAYFAKEPKRLTPGEAGMLIALPQLPETRRPDVHRANAVKARNRVLERIGGAVGLAADEVASAKQEKLPSARHSMPNLAAHSAALMRARDPKAGLYRLSIDRNKQMALEALARHAAEKLGSQISVAIILADHQSGAILARVGSPEFASQARRGYVDMSRAIRSPGSTLKPFIYGLGFEDGLIHPSTLIEDRPSIFGSYRPVNFDSSYQGTVTIRQALQMSLNIPAVSVLANAGPLRLMTRMKRAGTTPVMPDLSSPGLAIGLGGVGLTLEDLVSLYASLARGGRPVQLFETTNHEAAQDAAPQVLSEAAAWYVTDILRGTPPPEGVLRGSIAFKTGTSYGYRDAWSVGYNGEFVIGLWVGRADGTPIPGLSGRTSAAPLLFEAFSRVGGSERPFKAQPDGAYIASNEDLAKPLQHFTEGMFSSTAGASVETPPVIIFPPRDAKIDIAPSARSDGKLLAVKIQNGTPPFRWLMNGRPATLGDRRRQTNLDIDGVGFSTITVIDSQGRTDNVRVFLQE